MNFAVSVNGGFRLVKDAFGNSELYIREHVSAHEINKMLNLVDVRVVSVPGRSR